ncbi:hypothetical protein RB195_011477 [Necator americanus]|uniref:C2H2-type domain-containing protein n=1 Tax=Necator americanus TaxID=51031 RepID=A0ABR1D2L2_NECAM
MAPTAEPEGKYYPTRFRERLSIQKKYDDIFSCVVEKALMDTSLRPVTPSTLRNKLRKRASSECLPVKTRVRFDSERCVRYSSSSEDSGRSSTTELEDEDIVIIEKELSSIQCTCGSYVQTHSKLHEHIVTEHSSSAFACCPECGAPEVVLRNKYLCRICNVYSENLEDHLRIHYQDRTGGGALMECRTCYKTFQTVQEVRLHEQFSHGTQRSRTVSKHLCDYCELEFSSKHLRDVHLVSHFDRVIGSVWERIEQMQCEYTDQRLVNQCPICFSVMGSRKSFKLHIIQKHLTKNPESFMDILNRPSFMDKFPSVKQDAKTLPITNSVDSVLVKFELKEEPKDL